MSAVVLAERVLWFIPAFLQAVMAILMLRRKLYRELPVFFAYLIFKVALNCALWSFRHRMPHYFYIYWIGEAIGSTVAVGVIYEIFAIVTRPYEAIRRTGSLLYRWAAMSLLILATITAAMAPGMDPARIIEGILVLERGVRIVQSGLLLVLFLFASYLGMSWRSYVFGIALGFGIYASAELALVAIRTHIGADADQLYRWVKMIAFDFTTVLWTVYMLLPQAKHQTVTSLPKSEAAVWEQALMEYLQRRPARD
jgi:hypothetical protein